MELVNMKKKMNQFFGLIGGRRLKSLAVLPAAGFAVYLIISTMILPAYTMAENTICGKEEHIHTTDCYELAYQRTQSCVYAMMGKTIIHHHDVYCYDKDGTLICTLPEIEEHVHDQSCYAGGVMPRQGEFGADGVSVPSCEIGTEQQTQMIPFAQAGTAEDAHEHFHSGYAQQYIYDGNESIFGSEVVDDIYYAGMSANRLHPVNTEAGLNHDSGYQMLSTQPEAAVVTTGEWTDPGHIFGSEVVEAQGSADQVIEVPAGTLICGKQEITEHTHEAGCYDMYGNLICHKPEAIAHQHNEFCFYDMPTEWVLTCGKEEHTHTEACYAKEEQADNPDFTSIPSEGNPGQNEIPADQEIIVQENDILFNGQDTAPEDGTDQFSSANDTDIQDEENVVYGIEAFSFEEIPDQNEEVEAASDEIQNAANDEEQNTANNEDQNAADHEEIEGFDSVEAASPDNGEDTDLFSSGSAGEETEETDSEEILFEETGASAAQGSYETDATDLFASETETENSPSMTGEAAEDLFGSETTGTDREELFEEAETEETTESSPADAGSDSEEEVPSVKTAAPVVLRYEGRDYQVIVTCPVSANIPEGTVLKVDEIFRDNPGFEFYLDEAEKALDLADGTSLSSEYTRFYDIRMLVIDENGLEMKVEPESPVMVEIRCDDPVMEQAGDGIKANVVHFDSRDEELHVLETVESAAEAGLDLSERVVEETPDDSGDDTGKNTEDLFGSDISEAANDEESLAQVGFAEEQASWFGSDPDEIKAAMEPASSSAIRFVTDSFSVYGIVYTIETYFKTDAGETYKITVNYDALSGVPEDAQLTVSEIKEGEAGYEQYLAKSADALGTKTENILFARAFDITLQNPETGEAYKPSGDVQVRIELMNDNLDNYDNVNVIHVHGENENDVEVMDASVQGDSVEFTTDGFSVYVVTYTVDFHWGDYTYSIAGESEIRLSELLEKLGVNEISLADVADVVFSNPTLVEVETIKDEAEQTNDWLLRSLAPFSTEEALTLTLKNGKSVEIKVTDAQAANGTWENGSSGNGTWSIDENGVLTIAGTGAMIEYSGVTVTPWYDYINKNSGSALFATKLVFENGITTVGKNSFTRSFYVEEINAQNCTTLTTIGESAFKQNSLSGGSPYNISNPKRIDFSGCTSLNKINSNAFQLCQGIEYLDISETQLSNAHLSNTTAGFGAKTSVMQTFKANNCTNIKGTLDLSGYTSLTTLEISGCTGLTSLTVPGSVTTLDVSGCTGIDELDLSSCTSLTTLRIGNRNDLTDLSWLTIPDSVTTLDASGFTSLTSIDVPTSVTSLNLSGCTGLSALDLSNYTSLTDIDLSDNTSLTALKLPASVQTLDVSGCPNLVIYFDGTSDEFNEISENLQLPDGVQIISWGDYTYLMERNGSAELNEIFTDCGITSISSSDVERISVSDSSILQVSYWTLTNLKSFAEPQTLSVVLKNGFSGTIRVVCAPLEEFDNLNMFLDDSTVYSYEGETGEHPLSEPAILKQDEVVYLKLSFSEVPEGQQGERQMALLAPMYYTLPEGLKIADVEGAIPETVTISVRNGDDTVAFPASVSLGTDADTGAQILTVKGNYGDQEDVISASAAASFTLAIIVQPDTIPEDYALSDSMTLSVVRPHNAKVSIVSEEYDEEHGTIRYTVTVEAESDLDYNGEQYPVVISDLTTGDSPVLRFVSGAFTYTHKEGFVPSEGTSPSEVNGTPVDETDAETEFTGFPLTVAHMYDGDIITLTYTAEVIRGDYSGSGEAQVQNTVTITNEDQNGHPNPSNAPDDDTASVTTAVPYSPLTREYVMLDGSKAYWRVKVNPNGYTLNGGNSLTLSDTFDDGIETDARQSINYSSIVVSADSVSYDYSGNAGTFVIPDNTAVTITYYTHITAQPGEAALFRGTALLLDTDGNEIASSTAGALREPVVIYPSPSEVGGLGDNDMVKLFVYPERQMQQGIEGVRFILLDASQRPLEYKVGDNKGEPVTFTTGSDGYVNIELHEETGDVSIEKNTAYYLEMIQGVPGYQKDNTLYSFMITDDPDYNSGGFYTYHNGDTIKVRLYPASPGLNVSIRFSGSYGLREDQQNNVTAVLQMLDGEDNWIEVERHPYTDTQWGSIRFDEILYNDESGNFQNIYRVIEENENPWDLPDDIFLETTYYCQVNTGASEPHTEPQEFWAESADDSVNVVIDNRYEEPQLTIVKMDKSTGETLPDAVFSVYKIVNGEKTGEALETYTTDEDGELVIQGGDSFESETLYGITETEAPEDYLLPLTEEWHYFYFCNDEYLEPSILADLPEGETAVNLTKSGDRITIDNQRKEIAIPVMKIWQGGSWPENAEVLVGLYQSVEGSEAEPVNYEDGTPRTVMLTSTVPYNNTTFSPLPSRDEENRNITYSIKEESIDGHVPLDTGYNQEYGTSSAGVYIVRNKPATTLTVSKEWYDLDDSRVQDPDVLAAQSSVTFDIYRSSTPFAGDDDITSADMTAFVSNLVKVREDLSFGTSDEWRMSIRDLDKQDDLGNPYYYYVLETVPFFGTEFYAVDETAGTVTIKNKIAPDTMSLTVTKGALKEDPRPESLESDFEFTLKLKADDSHPIRSWQVYTDADNPENNLITDWDGKVTFTLKPTNPEQQSTPEASMTFRLPTGVTAAITETAHPEYTVETTSTVDGSTGDDGRTFTYETSSETDNVSLTYINTLRVICKVVPDNGNTEPVPFESIKSALAYIRSNPDRFTSPWTIYMLEDYTIPVTDVVDVREGESLILTTASTTDSMFPFHGGEENDRAVITRGGAGTSMLTNAGTLTLQNICLDGGNRDDIKAAGDGGLVYSTGTLNLNDKATLRNSTVDGKGGAVYAEGMVNIVEGAAILDSSASSASALYLRGTLNMTGGRITGSTGAADGAVVAENAHDVINLSGNPVIIGNTNTQGSDAANLYIGVDSDSILNVIAPGLGDTAEIGVTAMEGHMLIGEQFATAEFGQTENLNHFINDVYGYRGMRKEGTSTNIVWNGLTIAIRKVVDPLGANAHDRFTITLSSPSIVMSTYIIDGTLDYTITAARQGRPGRILLRNVKADDVITISPLHVGQYTIVEEASNYDPTFKLGETLIDGGSFRAEDDSTVTVTNTRRLAGVNLTKTLDDRLKAEDETQDFGFSVKLTETDGTPVSGFAIRTGTDGTGDPAFTTDENGVVSFTMSPTNAAAEELNFRAPVGAAMTITETENPNYRITASAVSMPAEGEGTEITDEDTDHDNIFSFPVTDDGADVTFENTRKMAEIELGKELVNKVSETESFAFTVTLTRVAGDPAADYILYKDDDNPDNNITTDDDGKAEIPFVMGPGETSKVVLLTIPEGTKLEVAETNVNGHADFYTTAYSINGAAATTGTTAVIAEVSDNDSSIAFTNTRKTNTITVNNTVNGYSGNVVPFTYTATVTDGAENDYDAHGFENGVMTFELTTGQSQALTVPLGATLTVTESFVVGYETTVKRGGAAAVTALSDTFVVTADTPLSSPLLFTNTQLIGLRLVNNTSSTLENVKVTVDKNKIYRVNADQTNQELIGSNKTATLSIAPGETAILEIQHDASVTAEQNYSVKGTAPAVGYYYTINNEPSFHEYANPAILRVYNTEGFEVKGKLRYSVQDSVVTFTEQPLVSFDVNGGAWTTEMEGYHDRDGDRKVYQKAVNTQEMVSKPAPDPIYPTEGVLFLGWTGNRAFAEEAHTAGEDVSDELYDFENTPVNAPVTLYAIWARDPGVRTVMVKNGLNEVLTVTVTLTKNGTAVQGHVLYEDPDDPADSITTDENGVAGFTLTAGGTKNLRVPDGVKLVLSAPLGTEYSTDYTDADSIAHSFTIESVEKDGSVAFIGGRFKITDADGNLLYDANGKPAIYMDLRKNNNADPDEAFDAFEKTLYTDASKQTQAAPAMVKQLVDEYTLTRTAATAFPNKTMSLTTAGKDDTDFPYVGTRDRGTIYRSQVGANVNCFTLGSGNITLTDIVLDGGSELGVKIAAAAKGGLINMTGGTLNINRGSTLRNVVYASYSNTATGGAICMTNGTLNVNAGMFLNLHAYRGGAIYVTGGTLNVAGTNGSTRFENCCTEAADEGDGGAIYYSNNKLLSINEGADGDAPGIVFQSCVARGSKGSGGAIYAATSGNQPVSVSGCSFIECSAKTEETGNAGNGGGAICANNVSELNVSSCQFDSCDTQSRGGAIVTYVKNGGTVSMADSSFDKCNCKGQGGALAVYQPNQESGSAPASAKTTKLVMDSCDFSNCSSGTNNGSGGAVQCYVPCMEFTDTSFMDCWAGKEGGAVNNYFANGYTAVWNESYMTLTRCTFIRCRAEDRYDPTALQHYGGGINTKVTTATVTDSYFEDCVSTLKEGGALHLGGQGAGSKATITGTTFKNCMAKNGGGAVLSSNETLEIENSSFYGCSSSGSNGGAVYHYRNSRGDSTQKHTRITDCVFGAAPGDDSETNLSCSAAQNGGAIWTRATTEVKLKNLTIEDCIAGSDGGGVYLDTKTTGVTITDGSITGCQAVNGSAVYVGNSATFSGELSVTRNIVSNINDGAIHGGKLYFEGNMKVENNTCSEDSAYNHDVLMQYNNATTIYTTGNGLGLEAHIGVYVPDQQFNNRGLEGKAFGTFNTSTDDGRNYLDAFFNDRNSELYGCELGSDSYIYWGIFVCKITDADGNTLIRPNGKAAVYQRLTMAFDEFTAVTGGTAVYVKMLLENYDIRQTGAISNFPSADITLTTETYTGSEPVTGKYDGKYPYRGTEGTVSTISRTNSTNQLFRLNNAGTTFQLVDIALDGRKDKTASAGDFMLIQADHGAVVVNRGTTMQYGKAGANGGGAIYALNADAPVTVNGVYDTDSKEPTVKFINCTGTGNNKPSGGAIRAVNLNIYNSSEKPGEFGTVFTSCSAYNGGAISVTGSVMEINGVFFEDCHSQSAGGAVYHNNANANTSTTVRNCAFEECFTDGNTWAHGGAIEARTRSLSVEDCSFKNCRATSDGGAVYHGYVDGNNKPSGSREITSIINTTFTDCRTIGTDVSYSYGGSVYTQAAEVEIAGSTFRNSTAANHGGALYCQCSTSTSGSAATISGTVFENCSTTREGGYGGAICSANKSLTLQKYTPEGASKDINTTINACAAPGYSGAVYMETTGSTLDIKDSTVISNCNANQGGAIYLPDEVTLNLTGSPEFSQNGYTTQDDGTIVDAEAGACIFVAEGSRINLKDSPKFSRNILPNESRIPNGGVTDFVRQDIYLAGYESDVEFDTNAASIYVVGELTGDPIWVWPEKLPHRLPNQQFAKIADGVTVSEDSLNHFRNSLSDQETHCSNGEYLAGVRVGTDTVNVYWDKMYVVSFKKIDNKGVPVPKAEFTLFKDLACTEEHKVAAAVSADGENDTDAQGKLLTRGMVEFTSVRIGAYYMKETRVPSSYKENDTTYLVLVGTPYLSKNESNKDLWEGDGPLNVDNAETLVYRLTADAGKFFGIFPLDANNKAVLRANLASGSVGIENIRNDYQVSFMKVDGHDEALPGAAFTIYSAILDSSGQPDTFEDGYPKLMLWSRDGENYPAPVVSADGTNAFKDVNNRTLPKGLVYFRELPLGTYYLLETEYPERNGNNRRTYYAESDRVFRLEVEEIEESPEDVNVTISEWKPDTASFEELPKDAATGYYMVSNREVVCKLTDDADNLLYIQGHEVWENKESSVTARFFPAIYETLEDGFTAAQTGSFVYDSGEPADMHNLKLKVLKDFTISSPILYDSSRAITFTTAETKVTKDRYIFSTTRTTDTSSALVSRGYNEDTSENANAGALITLASGADMTLENIRLNGQKDKYNGRAIHVTSTTQTTGTGGEETIGSILNIGTHTQIENFIQEAAADSKDAHSVKGGAILLEDGTSLMINGGYNRTAIFTGNAVVNNRPGGSAASDEEEYSDLDGGAIAVGTNCIFNITNAQFNKNSAAAASEKEGSGGAVSIGGDGILTLNNVTMNRNSATYGGAVSVAPGANVSFTGCTISGNNAAVNGGAFFLGGSEGNAANVLISGGTITGNSAAEGSAAYAEDYAEIIVSGSSITRNTANGANGGAINVGGPYGRLYFGGNPTVFDNFGSRGNIQQMNVVLSEDYNDVINTTQDGLLTGLIGVFVIETDSSEVFENHGLPGKPFGTFGDTGRANPQVFRNDNCLALYGVRNESDTGDTLIYWVDVICKLTDANDNVLYQDISLTINGKQEKRKGQAVYARITEPDNSALIQNGFNVLRNGFEEAQGTLYTRSASGFTEFPNNQTVKLKMLKDVALDKGIKHAGSNRDVTFTTAEQQTELTEAMKAAGDFFPFKTEREDAAGNPETKALITRAFDGASMIAASGRNLSLTDITLDGRKDSYSVAADGGIVYVRTGGSLTVASGAALQNSETTGNGGAVYVAAGGTATVSGGTISSNAAANGAGIYLVWNNANEFAVLNLSGDPSFGGTDRITQADLENSADEGKTVDDLKGEEGNFVRKDADFKTDDKEPTNGGKQYRKDGDSYLVRQDIYIAGTAEPHNAIRVTDAITSGDGMIWVWADNVNHYDMLKQFAVFYGNGTSLNDDVKETTMNAFRNAQPDSLTNCGGDYLTGQKGEVSNWIYWTGGFDVVFLKTDGYGGRKTEEHEGLPGAEFTLYTDEECTTPFEMTFLDEKRATTVSSDGTAEYKDKNGNTVTLEKGEVLLSKVPPKTFYMKETAPPEGYNRDENKNTIYKVTISGTGELSMMRKGSDDTDYVEVFKELRQRIGDDLTQYVVIDISETERKVILRKVNETYTSLQGAEFQIFRYDGTRLLSGTEGSGTYTSTANGVYFIDKLPYGTYYLYEKTAPTGYTSGKWFTLTVGNDTDSASKDGIVIEEITDAAVIGQLTQDFAKP